MNAAKIRVARMKKNATTCEHRVAFVTIDLRAIVRLL